MNLKSTLFAVALLSGVVANAGATIITSTSKGVITSGIDGFGFFGQVGANLTGLHYSQTISLDRSLNVDSTDPYYGLSMGNSPATVVTTVNNVTYTRLVSPTGGGNQFYVANYGSLGAAVNDGILAIAQDHTDVLDFEAYQYNFSTSLFVGAIADPGLHYVTNVHAGDDFHEEFYLTDLLSGKQTRFLARPDSIEFNALEIDATVPEPGTAVLLGVGFIGVAINRRRKSSRSDSVV